MTGFHPDALAEIERARDWYEDKRPGLGGELVDQVERVLERIEAAPTSFARTPESRAARRALLGRFPYWMVFSVLDNGDDVLIVALAHAKRRAGYWRQRVGGQR